MNRHCAGGLHRAVEQLAGLRRPRTGTGEHACPRVVGDPTPEIYRSVGSQPAGQSGWDAATGLTAAASGWVARPAYLGHLVAVRLDGSTEVRRCLLASGKGI
jgi:hypothetical protein